MQSVALAAGAAIIGAGEPMETSVDVWALRQDTEIDRERAVVRRRQAR